MFSEGIGRRRLQKVSITFFERLWRSVKNLELGFFVVLNVVSGTFLVVCFLSLKESFCKTRKIVFYFTSKALFVLQKV